MPKITHLIYDFDGLLLDTEPIYCRVNEMIAARYGKQFTRALHRKIMGRQAMDCAQILVAELDLPLTAEAHLQARDELIFDMLPEAMPMPGAKELTQRFYELGVKQAIATSSAAVTFNLKTQRYQDWLAIFNAIVLGSDPAVKRSKPAPDSFLVAAQRLGAQPAECLVFEDSPAGVTAAKQAGMSVVAVPAAHMDKAMYREADEVLTALSDFEPQRWMLP
ncbi:MAG: pseudouridine-5'-monophosphatase [Phormidesmis priestleyi Ana]|uniref:Pseudouridine-5'-monophosphatase n=1 Tax=Phormidesmis priestleyi Ana TaxID=1666911 RepID=A0A0P8C7A0_9CYAN|nr:MAG: pseudouridine-5'-monophosphatase [Phormidesmis priestleyi Ana]